tara:strand:- start:1057 stop:1401 length:345 start_codon:yes stop_codon:yes gene_type:complete
MYHGSKGFDLDSMSGQVNAIKVAHDLVNEDYGTGVCSAKLDTKRYGFLVFLVGEKDILTASLRKYLSSINDYPYFEGESRLVNGVLGEIGYELNRRSFSEVLSRRRKEPVPIKE